MVHMAVIKVMGYHNSYYIIEHLDVNFELAIYNFVVINKKNTV